MLLSVALEPKCLGPGELTTPDARAGAERLLEGVCENAILLAGDVDAFVDELIREVMQLEVGVGQEIQLLAAEIAKNRARCIVTPHHRGAVLGESPLERVRRLSIEMRADVAVIPCNTNPGVLADLPIKGVEVCTVAQYRASKAEARRKTWLHGQRLDKLAGAEIADIVGRAVRYCAEILVVDKMIARAGKDGHVTGSLERAARGIIHVAKQWRVRSPYSRGIGPSIVVLSVAGGARASTGFVDGRKAEKAIRETLARMDRTRILGPVTIDLRQEASPPVFKDRFLGALGRCWSISHGWDDIGNLADAKAKRGPTVIVPDCQAYRDILADIKLLPKA